MSNTKYFSDLVRVCSVLPALLIMPSVADANGAAAQIDGKNYETLTDAIDDAAIGAKIDVLRNVFYGTGKVINSGSNFSIDFNNNSYHADKKSVGSAGTETQLFQILKGSNITMKNGNLSATSSGDAEFKMLIQNYSDLILDNMVIDGRGDIVLYTVSNNNGNVSINNSKIYADAGQVALDAYYWPTAYGDVVVNVDNTEIVGRIEATVQGVKAIADTARHEINIHGGVLAAETSGISKIKNNGTINLSDLSMNGNKNAENGSAIYNETILMSDGAVAGRGIVNITNVEFAGNSANSEGGAIFNRGTMNIVDSEFENNIVFDGFGGAVKNNGKLTITDTDFSENVAYVNGAVATSGKTGEIEIYGGKFENNYAMADGGALGLYKKALVSGTEFERNKSAMPVVIEGEKYAAASDSNGGGALFVGQLATATLKDVRFIKNETGTNGGAIHARHFKEDNAFLDIDDAYFKDNSAKNNGGAISNIYSGYVDIKNAEFEGNIAGSNGGAIYNGVAVNYGSSDGKGTDSTGNGVINLNGENKFTGNHANLEGGAIFNDVLATVNISGINTFSGNTAGKYSGANDIHNLGVVNVLDGTTTLDGGVTGNGTLNLAKGAVLNIGTANINQSKIIIDGTINADVLSAERGQYIDRDKKSTGVTYSDGGSYAKLFGEITGQGVINLNVGSAGTYKMFDSDNDIKISAGMSYVVTNNGADGVVIETKSIDALAQDAGISTQAAGAVAGLAHSTDRNAQKISLLTQQALNSGDVKTVERETAKLNPDDKPVAQAVSASVQNQVLSLTSGRMSGGGVTIGRSGGDVARENGFWMQGLFNKSKHADQFHGYTRGFALGGDIMLNNEWLLGGGFAYNTTDVHANNSRNTDIESNTLFTYVQYKPNKWFANMTLSYTMSEYDENVDLYSGAAMLNSNYDIDAYGAQFMTGYDFATGITTEVGARYLHVAQEEYTNGLNTVKSLDTDFLSGVAGLKYAFAIQNDWTVQLKPEIRAAVTYDIFSDDAAATVVMPGAAPYKVAGERLSRMGGEFGIGLTAKYKGAEFSLMYDLDLHEDYTSQTGMIKFRSQF